MLYTNNDKQNMNPAAVPFVTSLPDGSLVVVDAMTDSQISETFQLIRDASERGQGFGMDEYASESDFREDIRQGHKYAIMSKGDDVMLAACILAVSRYSRGCNVADPIIIVRPEERGKRVGEFCLTLAETLARRLGFIGIYTDTFSNNIPMIRIIERLGGYEQVGHLPAGGVMQDGTVVGSLIYYKDLRPDTKDGSDDETDDLKQMNLIRKEACLKRRRSSVTIT